MMYCVIYFPSRLVSMCEHAASIYVSVDYLSDVLDMKPYSVMKLLVKIATNTRYKA